MRHIDITGERFDLNNGRTLCLSCHRKTDNYGHKAKQKTLS